MTKKITIPFLLLSLVLSSCGLFRASSGGASNEVNFTFLQVNDVYEIAPLEGGKLGGMARVASLKQALLKENPNTYLFLAGDFLSPSVIGTVKIRDEKVAGKQMV
ncbi:MAG: bifunctional metallophosphatase/5'-nucleotidase, partial [Bacteroidia bacterium]